MSGSVRESTGSVYEVYGSVWDSPGVSGRCKEVSETVREKILFFRG